MPELKDKPIEHYRMNEPSEPIILHVGPMTLDLDWVASDVEEKESNEPFKTTKKHQENILSEEGILKWEWHPTPKIRFELRYKGSLAILIPLYKHCTLSVTDLDLKEEGYVHGPIWLEPDNLQHGSLKPLSAMQEGFLRKKCLELGTSFDRLTEVRFHVVNFRNSISKWKDGGTEGRDIFKEHTKLDWIDFGWNIKVKDWDIELRPAQNCDELVKSMDRVGGFAITHVGLLKRTDGKEFSSEQVEKVLDALYYLFSFIRGRWCGIVLPKGISRGMVVWEKWNLTKPISPWGYNNNWAASLSAVIDDNFIQQFIGKWNDLEWQHDIMPVLNWYIEVCLQAGGLDGAIAMTQFGLERLAWIELRELGFTDLVSDRYDGIPAHSKLRWLLDNEKIPVDLRGLDNLFEYAKHQKIMPLDGPQAITYIRNNIVHPEKNEATLPSVKAMGEAYYLGLWYLEMSLLHRLGYNGQYFDRRHGSINQVPWSK